MEERDLEEKAAEQLDNNRAEAEELLKDKQKMQHFLDRLEKRLASIPVAGKYLADVPVLISLVKAYIDKGYTEIPIGSLVAIVGALIYVLSTIDLIPDVIPVVGFVDDAIVVAAAYKLVHDDVEEYKAWRDENKM